jgi:large subunit ribosomal protein L20
MVRIKRGNTFIKRRKKFLKLAKGYLGSNSRLSTLAMEQIIQSLNFAYIGRKLKKRNFRSIWIHRINVASRARQNIYSELMGSLRNSNVLLNRKLIANLACNDLSVFNLIERQSKMYLQKKT